MIAVDTNVVVYAHPELMSRKEQRQLEEKIESSREVLNRPETLYFPLWCYLELLGIVSYRLDSKEWKKWAYYFGEYIHPNIDILWFGKQQETEILISAERIVEIMEQFSGLHIGDAVILHNLESAEVTIEVFLTWDKKLIKKKSDRIKFRTPRDFLRSSA